MFLKISGKKVKKVLNIIGAFEEHIDLLGSGREGREGGGLEREVRFPSKGAH